MSNVPKPGSGKMCAFALRATARRTTLQAFVAASTPDHDAAAFMAGGSVRLRLKDHLFVPFDRSGGSHRRFLHPHFTLHYVGRRRCRVAGRRGVFLWKEFKSKPSGNVVADGFCDRDFGIIGEARGFIPCMAELVYQNLQRNPILQRDRDRRGKGVHQSGDG